MCGVNPNTNSLLEIYVCEAHQTGVGVVEPVVQGEALHQLKQGGMVKVAGVGRNELIHAVLLRPVCVCVAITSSNTKRCKQGSGTGKVDSKRGKAPSL